MAERQDRRRSTFGPVVLLGLVGAALAAVAGGKPWVSGRSGAFDTSAEDNQATVSTLSANGAGESPLALALALVVLACWGVVLVTRGRFRRAVTVLALVASLGLVAATVEGYWSLPSKLADALQELSGADTASTAGDIRSIGNRGVTASGSGDFDTVTARNGQRLAGHGRDVDRAGPGVGRRNVYSIAGGSIERRRRVERAVRWEVRFCAPVVRELPGALGAQVRGHIEVSRPARRSGHVAVRAQGSAVADTGSADATAAARMHRKVGEEDFADFNLLTAIAVVEPDPAVVAGIRGEPLHHVGCIVSDNLSVLVEVGRHRWLHPVDASQYKLYSKTCKRSFSRKT